MKKLDKKEIEDILALTPMQEGMLFHYLKNPESNHYFEQLSLEISGEVDREIFAGAWNFVIKTNEMLRTVFYWEKIEKPVQIVLKAYKLLPGYYDCSDRDSRERGNCPGKIKEKDRQERFDLKQIPLKVTLCKVEEKKYRMIISNHHILYDGWSSGIILRELFDAYNDLSDGKELVKPVKTKFSKFVNWIQNLVPGEQKNFWRDYLAGFDTQTGLSIKRRESKEISGIGTYQTRFETNLEVQLENFTRNYRVTMASLIYTALGLLLQKYNNCSDVIFGTTVSGRTPKIKGIEDIVGLFINTIPLRVQTFANEKIADLLYRIDNALPEREKFENTSLVKIKEYSELDNREELFDTIIVIENYPLTNRLIQEERRLSIDSYSMVEKTHYDLTLNLRTFDDIELTFAYNKKLFDEDTIARLANHFKKIVSTIANEPGITSGKIDILSGEEKKQLLEDFNRTVGQYPKDKTLHQLFEEQVNRTPHHAAVIFHDRKLTYKELNRKSNRLARVLKEKGMKINGIAGILLERSLEMIVAILAVLKSGGAYLPIDPQYPSKRIKYMLRDSHADIVLSGDSISPGIEFAGQVVRVNPGEACHYNYNKYNGEGSNVVLPVTSGDLAYIIYTSGSTGTPRGVMVEHGSVINLAFYQRRRFRINARDRVLQFSSITFDASVEQIFISLFSGAGLVLIARETLLDHNKFAAFLSHHVITHLHAVPSFLKTINVRGTHHLKRMISGGDICPPTLAKDWYHRCEFYNEYGPTETTVTSIEYRVKTWDSRSAQLPIGKALGNTKVYILDRWGNPVPCRTVGELVIGGQGVARGYLNNPELTAEKFDHDLWDYLDYQGKKINYMSLEETRGPGPLVPGKRIYSVIYRTGDLARWLPDGNIEFLGRIDHQVKIRGFRIELGEIENQLLNIHQIKEAVVTVGSDETGDNFICAYIVLHAAGSGPGSWEVSRYREYLQRRLPDYMVPAYFVQLAEMPLTSTGKIDRKALPEPRVTSSKKYIAPQGAREEALAEIWSEVLGIEKEKIGIDDHFFELGGQSLKAIQLISKIHKEFDVPVPLAETFKLPTVRSLAGYINTAKKRLHNPVELAEKKEYYPLSSPQKRLYILQQMEKNLISYNISGVLVLEGEPEKGSIPGAFHRLIRRHESLRTSFEVIQDQPVQRIHQSDEVEKVPFGQINAFGEDLATEDTENTEKNSFDPKSYIKNFIRPFDLSRAPLFRVGLIKTGALQRLLVVDMHHIISDGSSVGIIIKEFAALYEGKEPPALRLQYKDFARWQHREKENESIKQQEMFWLKEFSGNIPVLNLDTDFPGSAVMGFEGNKINFEIGGDEFNALKALALKEGATLYMVLLAIVNILFHKLTGDEDIIVGTVSAGRRHTDLEQVIGMFVNTLALRNYPNSRKSAVRFLEDIKRRTLKAFENQDYQFEDLVEKVSPNRDTSRNPLFNVMLTLQDPVLSKIEIQGLKVLPHEYENPTSKFDLTLLGLAGEDKLLFKVEYRTNLFNEKTIKRFVTYFKNVVSCVLSNPGEKISNIEIISEEEKNRILYEFNASQREYPANKTLRQLFAEQMECTPHHVAVAEANLTFVPQQNKNIHMHYVSFKELHEKSTQLGYYLCQQGISPGEMVGIMVTRSLEMIIGLLAIIKAGCAYIPLDPQAPVLRTKYVLEESSASMLLTTGTLGKKVGLHIDMRIIYFEESASPTALPVVSPGPSHPSALAYIIFTSGSTGKPKGVPITHANLSPLLHWGYKHLGLNSKDRVIQNLSYYFDWSVWEIFFTLTSGSGLYIAPDEILLNPESCIAFLLRCDITVLYVTPSQYQYLCGVEAQQETLKYLFFGAEKLTPDLVKRSTELVSEDCRIFNTYGPTECSITASVIEIERSYDNLSSIPIGRPVGNTGLLVLDKYLKLCPLNIVGELYISGEGLAPGYLNDPEKSCKYFIPNIYKSGGIDGDHLYKTGDRTRWLTDGNIEFLGRIDHQVKIRGFRVELGEIETQLLGWDFIKECVVTIKEKNGEKYLCAYVTAAGELDTTGLRDFLSHRLPDYMIPSYFVPVDKMPLNPNGKIDRKALPEPGIQVPDKYKPPGNKVEEKLATIWAEVLGIEKDMIGIDSDFFQLGGHSLKATIMASKIHKELNIKLPLAEIFKTATIRQLAESIKGLGGVTYKSIALVEKKEYYELSSAQKRLYMLQQMDLKSINYNMPGIFILEGKLTGTKVAEAFQRMIDRHEPLRTSFRQKSGEPVQRINDKIAFKIKYKKIDNEEDIKNPAAEFIEPFDLSTAPLFRVELIEVTGKKHFVLYDLHHIISDGISMRILENEFNAFYEGKKLEPIKCRYKDYAVWHNKLLNGEDFKNRERFWLNQMKGFEFTRLPLDKFSSYRQVRGETETGVIDKVMYEKIKKFCHQYRVTEFMFMITIFNILLAQEIGQRDITIGIPFANRDHYDLKNVMGIFLNVLLIRMILEPGDTFLNTLEKTKKNVVEAMNNSTYPYELLNDKMKRISHLQEPELFTILFNYFQVEKGKDILTTRFTVKPPDLQTSPKYDATLYISDTSEDMELSLVYKSNLFDRHRAKQIMKNLLYVKDMVMEDEHIKIKDINLGETVKVNHFQIEIDEGWENDDLLH